MAHQKTTTLSNLVLGMSGGATPLKAKGDIFYSDKTTGVPFLRVKNITEDGINDKDLIYINRKTHDEMLFRSKVFQNDLLVTITGRIASAAVAPDNFEGNINQHSVVIKTSDKDTSEYIACFLNSTVGHKLAIREATGGTRPALDYKTLGQMPVICGLPIVAIMKKSYAIKVQIKNKAQQLLNSIDDYLLSELGISLSLFSEKEERIFYRKFTDIAGGRIDPCFYKAEYEKLEKKISESKNIVRIDKICRQITSGKTPSKNSYSKESSNFPIIKTASYTGDFIDFSKLSFIKNDADFDAPLAQKGDIYVLAAAHQATYVGKSIYFLDSTPPQNTRFVAEFLCIRANIEVVLPDYLFYILNTPIYKTLLNREKRGQTSHLYPQDVKRLKIPLLPLNKQREIVAHINAIHKKIKNLRAEADAELENAKKQVEKIILGKV